MPYGTMLDSTREYVEKRARESNVDLEKLGLEAELPDEDSDEPLPDNLHQISVIFGGALDEEFYVQTDYEVNIADWIAEQCHDEANKQGGETWEIIVSEFAWEGGGSVRYRVSDETYQM